ncbi:MAG: hypothetical protein CFE21_11960 [Bacteroidetes bacterium B1(2017)]|nr:MAG: hypothetical protein CFE21_11960 [Bacteroidetes bacterium B1(2017)]
MKKLILLLLVAFAIQSNSAFAQLGGAMDKLAKQGSAAATDAKNSSTSTILGNLDKSLKDQFKLDGVKSQIMGDVLKIKVADTDFTKLSAASKTKQGNQIADAASSILGGSGLNLQGLGLKNIIVEMFKSMSLNDILATIKKPI